MPESPQILLPLERRRPDRLEDFMVGANSAVVRAIEKILQTPGSALFLCGPPGCGKTHLLNAAANRALEHGVAAFCVGLGELPESAAAKLADLDTSGLLCLDDLDLVIGKEAWETALFHGFNRLRAASSRLIVSSTLPLSALQFGLADLQSRLSWGLRLKVEPLDDAGKRHVLRKRSASRGFELPRDVEQYLLSRGPRNLGELAERLEAIIEAALTRKRRITVPLAREILERG